jgi:hypothetical protein
MKMITFRVFAFISFMIFSSSGIFGQQPYKLNPAISLQFLDSRGMNVYLRASYIIELHKGFEVTEEGEFFADVIGGCDAGY